MSHQVATRHPMSEARRQHVHGPLVSAYRPSPFMADMLGTAAVLLGFCAFVFAFSAMTP